MKKGKALNILVLSTTFLWFLTGCVTDTATLKIEKSLPQSKLAYYQDSFHIFRADLWEKAGATYNEEQEANFKYANMRFNDSGLRVQTESGCFSKGGLASKFSFRGNFDIQIDCRIDFLKGLYDMDQCVYFLVMEKSKPLAKADMVSLSLLKKGGRDFGTIYTFAKDKGLFHRGNWYKIEGFDGSLRIVRIGDEVTTLFKRKGNDQWKEMDTFRSTSKDFGVGFLLQNFIPRRNSITARSPVTATFDNFRINAAEQITEEEI